MSVTPELYLWLKALHIIGVVVWFAGLFYLVRLFIYHVESKELASELKEAFSSQYSLMERRLANIITTPGMILTLSMAFGLLVMQPSWLSQTWMRVKLLFVLFLLIYHFFCSSVLVFVFFISNWKNQYLFLLNFHKIISC